MRHSLPVFVSLLSTLIACNGGASDKGATDDTGGGADTLADALSCPAGDAMVIADVDQLSAVLAATVPMSSANTLDSVLLQLARDLDVDLAEAGEPDCVDLVEDLEAGTADLSADCVEVLDGVTLTGAMSSTVIEGGYESVWTGLTAANADILLEGEGAVSFAQTDVDVFQASADRSWTSRIGLTSVDGVYTLSASGTTNTPGEIYSGSLIASDAPSVPDGVACFASTGLAEGEHESGATLHELVQASQLWEIFFGADACRIVTADGVEIEDTCS